MMGVSLVGEAVQHSLSVKEAKRRETRRIDGKRTYRDAIVICFGLLYSERYYHSEILCFLCLCVLAVWRVRVQVDIADVSGKTKG